jgi:hypothetical protein
LREVQRPGVRQVLILNKQVSFSEARYFFG